MKLLSAECKLHDKDWTSVINASDTHCTWTDMFFLPHSLCVGRKPAPEGLPVQIAGEGEEWDKEITPTPVLLDSTIPSAEIHCRILPADQSIHILITT